MSAATELDDFTGHGDVVNTPEQPILEQSVEDVVDVMVNISYARLDHGARSIRVQSARGESLVLTAAQAHQVALDLLEAADDVSELRQKAGHEN